MEVIRRGLKGLWPGRPARKQLLVVVACMLGWPLLTALLRLATDAKDFYGVPFALGAVLVASWAGGLASGLSVTLLSVLLLGVTLPAVRVIGVKTESAWHLLVFALVAVSAAGFEAASRHLNDQLRQEVEYKNSFLSLMAHELRTPATLIYSGARLLSVRAPSLSTEETMEVISTIESESGRFATLIDDILTYSRIEAGRHEFQEEVSMEEVVRNCVGAFRKEHPARSVSCHLPAGDYSVWGREQYLEIVVRHLLANADAYTPSTKPVVVSLSRRQSSVTVSVHDHGPGLSKSELRSIFEPYYRGSVPAGLRGLGLGLTLCKRVVEAMDGRIVATSPEGDGLDVSFTLPSA